MPPPLPDELVEEVLLRLLPDIPASIARAGLVCKRWRHLLSDPDFPRRFREFHRRSPPVLGFLYNTRPGDDNDGHVAARFVPTSPSRVPHWAQDSRHGRVLLFNGFNFVVCVPIADERYLSGRMAAVLCASAVCDHLDCHHGPFIVVLVGTMPGTGTTCSFVYSSAADAWGEPIYGPHSDYTMGGRPRSALVGNALYFVFEGNKTILEYDLGTGAMSVIELPREQTQPFINLFGPIELTSTVDGRLGFARVEMSRLCVWSMEEAGGARWVLR
ncbi:hypothetical protein U9M48_004854 [Paspalum notatum var. saurae]|uniref:F-box domain-containing protein n=1 Tax=Paspalum notatum var. saurae TaxID=547442 RepID=A0AAQ3SLK2_PASNO